MRTARQLFALGTLTGLCSCSSIQPCPPAPPLPPVSVSSAATAGQANLLEIKQGDVSFDRLESSKLFEMLQFKGKLEKRDLLDRLSEESSLLEVVKSSRDIAIKKQGPKDSRQFVMDFAATLKSKIERQIGKVIGPVPFDTSALAEPMYKNLAAMIRNTDEVSNYRGDRIAAMARVEAVSLLPRGEQCTGVIIARNAIATATHCAIYGPTFIRIGDSATDGSNEVAIEPSHFQHIIVGGADLDMSILVQPARIPGIRDEDLPVFATDSMIASAEKLSIVGFGGYYTDSSEAGVKRLGKVPMLSPDCSRQGEAEQFKCHPGFDIVAGSRALLDRPTCPADDDLDVPNGACSGDSGGPVYVANADGRLFLAGMVSSTVDPHNCGCSAATNVYVRFDKQIAFLRTLGVDFPPQALAVIDSTAAAAPGGQ